jgi:phospholipid-translocating P-type ATPase (flippase)
MAKVQDSEIKRIFYANGCEVNKSFLFPSNYLSTTKYNILTFLPFSLFIQFRRVANIYFLITAILQSISFISPLQPFSAIAPLVFVLSVSMIREAIEDYFRYRSDKEVNSDKTMIYKNGKFIEVKYEEVQVGHIVLVKKDQVFPCDLIMLSNSSANAIAYIETSTIDGEKNLKTRQPLDVTSKVVKPDSIIRMFSMIECDEPNPRIYQFAGTIDYMDKKYSIGKDNLLLAGALLRNTSWAIGVSTYTGSQTKLRMNLMSRRIKQSKIERIVNTYILYIILFQFLTCLACAILYGFWVSFNYSNHYYLGSQEYSSGLQGFITYFTYFILLNTMLPISLIISLELLKLAQGFFMQEDLSLYSYLRDRPCKVSSFSLNEELGMIEHIFTDKTGTLTCNKMQFKYCSVGDKIYGENSFSTVTGLETAKEPKAGFNATEIQKDFCDLNSNAINFNMQLIKTQKDIIEYLLKCMALCHECLIEETSDGLTYIGQSPDEITLVDSAMKIGVKYARTIGNIIEIQMLQGNRLTSVQYERICLFEFDSDRKRNSIVVKDLSNNKHFLFIKGADNIMLGLLSNTNTEYTEKISKDLLGFSEKGFRTLVLGYKVIEREEFEIFKAQYDEASCSIDCREERIKKAAEMIESNVTLLGCTAVEDSLQDQVPETIQDLLAAGINIWMLTGDKLETALNIGKTCSLLTDKMLIEKCPSGDFLATLETLRKIITNIESTQSSQEIGLVIEGTAIDFILNTPLNLISYQDEIMKMFLKLSEICKTVICCRVTPGQKKDVLRLIKNHRKCVTLAIGDGANDVSMILEAQVGIGLYGEEGMQAVQASDYAIGEFKLLWDLLFVHGRFNYIRQSELILYFIYKNLVFTLPQLYFAFYCAYSGQTVYDDWYITTYNMILTALPLLVRGLFEKDIKIPTRKDLLKSDSLDLRILRSKVPYMYITGRKNMIFTTRNFVTWVFYGIFHSVLIFFLPLYASKNFILNSGGKNIDFTCFSITSFTCIIFIVNLKLSLNTRLWNIYHWICLMLLSIFLYFGFILTYDVFATSVFYDSIFFILASSYFYLCIFVTACWVLVLDGAWSITKTVLNSGNTQLFHFEPIKESNSENNALNP